jgi:hypothetical protein
MKKNQSLIKSVVIPIMIFFCNGCGEIGSGKNVTPSVIIPLCTPTIVTGWARYEDEQGDFSIAVPASWEVIETEPELIDSSLQKLENEHPAFYSNNKSWLRDAWVFDFLAYDLSSEVSDTDYSTSVDVSKSYPPFVSLDSYSEEYRHDLISTAENLVEPIRFDRNKLGFGEVQEIAYDTKITLDSGETRYSTTYIILTVQGNTAFSIKCSTSNLNKEEILPILIMACRSFWPNEQKTTCPINTNLIPDLTPCP